MPFADTLMDAFRSRGASEIWRTFKRGFAPASAVLHDSGPTAGRLATELSGIDDDVAAGMGRTMSTTLPLDVWEKVPEAKRLRAVDVHEGLLDPTAAQRELQDPEIATLVRNMGGTFANANAENLAATDPLGNPLEVRNPFSGEKRPYQPIAENYFPHFVKRSKRDSILDPMHSAQADIERKLTDEFLTKFGLDRRTSLDTPDRLAIQETASAALDEFFRTGQPNAYLSKPMRTALDPAYKSFREITDHLRGLQVAKAQGRGQTLPPEVDPVLQLFGSDDPTAQRAGIRMFREFLLRDAQNARRFGSIESSRALPLPKDWYERDPLKVVPQYEMRRLRRLAEIKRFGQDNEVVLDPAQGWLSQIPDDRDREFAKRIFDRHMGLEPYNKSLAMNKLMDTIFATQVIKLGTAQISQLGQVMNVLMETGLTPTFTALSDLGRSKDIAIKSGAALTRVMDIVREGLTDPMEQSGPRKFTEGFLKWTGFNKADLLARHIGAGAGYAHGQEILRRIVTNPGDVKALREVRRLLPGMHASPRAFAPMLAKITAARTQLGERPTLEQIEQFFGEELLGIARTASLNANFRQSILDVPGWATTPLGRMVSMFRTFAYKQTNFVRTRVLDDLRQGNPRPLVGLAAGAGVLGPLIGLLKSVPQGRLQEELEEWNGVGEPTGALVKALDNIATVGALGLFDQTARAMRRGDLGWYNFIGGPLFTDVVQLLGGTGKVAVGATGFGEPELVAQGERELGRFVGAHVPVVGGTVSRAVRTLTEDVERSPSGLVSRTDSRSPIGTESPPVDILGLRLPSPRVLFGLEESAPAKRERILAELKAAIESGDRAKLSQVVAKAREQGVVITKTSITRLLRDQAHAGD